MKRLMLTSLMIGILGAAAWAQDAEQPQEPRVMVMEMGGDHAAMAGRMYSRFADELELDDGQRQEWDRIVAARRERMREMAGRVREIRLAAPDGDQERVAQVRVAFSSEHGAEGVSAALDEIEPFLREEQVAKLWEIQDRMQSRGSDHANTARAIRGLPEELGLNKEQRAEFEKMLASGRQRMGQRWAEMRPLFEEMRAAREADDQQRLAELRRELEESRPAPDSMFEGFFEQLREILNADQKERLAAFQTRLAGGGDDGPRGPRDVRQVLRAARRLRLEDTQKSEIRDIERVAIRAWREIGRRDKQAQARLAEAVKSEIAELLDPQQTKQFEQQLQRTARRSRGR